MLVHRCPSQLRRLIAALEDGETHFFVHLDKKVKAAPFVAAVNGFQRVKFTRREDGAWGQFGIVQGTLHALQSIRETQIPFGIVNLISGQDYPLHCNQFIDRFFQRNFGKSFIEYWPVPISMWPCHGLDRILDYHVGDRRRRSRQRLSRLISYFCNSSQVLRRRHPSDLKPFGGWQWWALTLDAVDEILRFVAMRPGFARYHRWSLLPDELFFQTILLNSQSSAIVSRLVNNCLRFVDWDNPNPATPATITNEYFESLVASQSLFARKFDEAIDSDILDRIDRFRSDEEKRVSGLPECAFETGSLFPNSAASPGTKRHLRTSERSDLCG